MLILIKSNVRRIHNVLAVVVVVADIDIELHQTKTCSTDKVENIYYEMAKRIFVFEFFLSKRSCGNGRRKKQNKRLKSYGKPMQKNINTISVHCSEIIVPV